MVIRRHIWKSAVPLVAAVAAASALTVASNAPAQARDRDLVSPGGATSSAPVVFADPVEFPASERVWSVVQADFDGDGKTDAATSSGVNTMSVFRGNGDGTFGDRVDYETLDTPYFLAFDITTADFNGDRKPDLAVSGGNPIGNVGIYLNKGDGTFADPVAVSVGYGPNQVTAADVNRDGRADLITANNFAADVSVRLGRGNGTFRSERRFNVGPGPQGVTVADLNGDRRPDILTGNFGRPEDSLTVLYGYGNGSFHRQRNYAAGETVNDVVTGDFDNDGITDVAVGEFVDNEVSVMLGKRWGGLGRARSYPTGSALNELAVADVDNDGAQDIVSTMSPDTNRDPGAPPPDDPEGAGISVLLGNGNGTFAENTLYGMPGMIAAIKPADVNNDRRTDMVTVNLINQSLVIWLNEGTGR